MALFARICVLRGFPAAAYRKYASPKTLCGLDPDKGCSFINRKRAVPILPLWMGTIESGFFKEIFFNSFRHKIFRDI